MRQLRHAVLAVTVSSLLVASAVAGAVVSAGATTTTSTNPIAALALANTGKHACSTNSLGGKGFYSSCTGNGGQPEYWCADFARWVWAQSRVEDTGWLTAAAGSFYTYGLQYGTLTATPAVGDAAVFNYAGGGAAEHVALVTKVKANGQIETLSGDWGGQSGTEAQFASTSTAVLNSPAYLGVVGSWPAIMGMTLSGFVAPVGVPVHPISGRTLLAAGGSLTGTKTLTSPNGVFSLGLTQTGQLVEDAAGRTLWTSGTAGAAGDELVMQPDGNLVLETPATTSGGSPTVYWSSQTGGHSTGTFRLAIYDNGTTSVLDGWKALWTQSPVTNLLASGAALTSGQALISSKGMYMLYMQRDGNVVEYTAGRPIWWTGTGHNPGSRLLMRKNGRLVVLNPTGHVLWSSQVAGGDGTATLNLNDNATVSVDAGTSVLWSNGVSAWLPAMGLTAMRPLTALAK
jgi:hypothetical protein